MDLSLLAEAVELIAIHGRSDKAASLCSRANGGQGVSMRTLSRRQAAAKEIIRLMQDEVKESLRKKALTLQELSEKLEYPESLLVSTLELLEGKGFNIHQRGNKFTIEKSLPLPTSLGNNQPLNHADVSEIDRMNVLDSIPTYYSREDNTYVFGACGDNHLCSKYERLDVGEDLYDRFAAAGVDRVFNTGNWIEGESRFNKFDIHTHGMDAQCQYFAKTYPKRDGIVTYAVAGDDHEGWYAQREGVDIGKYAENVMRQNGREDWVDLGYMECFIRLVNSNTGKSAILSVVHPGGGSSYALSYSIQKIIESLDGGEKPAVGLYGHYHKIWAGNIRNVWCLQTGCAQDQTPFMRKKKLEAHVGGALVTLEQDPLTGAIIGFTPQLFRYFNKGYYNNRWSHSSEVDLPERAI